MGRKQHALIEPHLDQTLSESYRTIDRVTTALTTEYEKTPSEPLKNAKDTAFTAKEKLHEMISIFEGFAKNPKRRINQQQGRQLLDSLRSVSNNVRITEGCLDPLVTSGSMSDYYYNQLADMIGALDDLDRHLMGFVLSGRDGGPSGVRGGRQ